MRKLIAIATLAAASTLGVGQAAAPQLDSATQAQISQIVSSERVIEAQMESLMQKRQANMAQLRILQVEVFKKYPGYHLNWQRGTLEKNQ